MLITNLDTNIDYKKCQNEQQFKKMFLSNLKDKDKYYLFCIETEETVQGFPDVLCIDKKTHKVWFEEFKYTKTGKIKFQSTQPAFYRKYSDLSIHIIAYNSLTNTVHCIFINELFDKDSLYFMNEKAEVDLLRVEKELKDESPNYKS